MMVLGSDGGDDGSLDNDDNSDITRSLQPALTVSLAGQKPLWRAAAGPSAYASASKWRV